MSDNIEAVNVVRKGNVLTGKVKISYEVEVTLGYMGSNDDETMKKALVKSALEEITYNEVGSYE